MKFLGYGQQYDDMLGEVRSSIVGGTTWDVAAIGDTGFIIGWLKDNSGDMFQLKIQAPHRRVLQSVLGDIHLHYCLETNSTAGQTIVFDTKYTWIKPDMTIPSIGSWITSSITSIILGTHTAPYYNICNLAVDIPAITSEDYGSMILVKCVRGDGTYTGKCGVLDADAHSLMSKLGSRFKASDI